APVCGERVGERGERLMHQSKRSLFLNRKSLAPLPRPLPAVPVRRSRSTTFFTHTACRSARTTGAQRRLFDTSAARPARCPAGLRTAGAEPPAPPEPDLHQPAGCFVSLHEHANHRLRGCVGRLDHNLPLAQAVRETAADVLRDPRFLAHPVTSRDVGELEIEVSVLSPPREASSPLDFDLADGIYLT